MDENPLPCAECKYPGFRGLVYTCRHPEHPEPINGRMTLRILSHGGKCPHFVDVDKKIMAGESITWALPVSFKIKETQRGGGRRWVSKG